jgi:predicted RNA-binding Zn-ribbon protein involved in translation (DUF1610 family)
MDTLPRQRLTELVGRYGHDVADDPRRCEALLRDMCPQHKREIFVLVSAVKECVPRELLGSSSGIPKAVLVSRLTKRLHENLGVAENLARWAVESWALALGIASTNDLRFPFNCPACGAGGSMASRLAGQAVHCPKCQAIVRISDDGRNACIDRIDGSLDQFPRMQASKETVLLHNSSITVGISPATGDDDLFSEFPRVSTEDILRQTLRRVLADGIVTDEERAEVHQLRKNLGIAPEVATRILAEVKAEMGVGQPITTGLSVTQPIPPLPNVNPGSSSPAMSSRPLPQSGHSVGIEFRCIRCGKLLRTNDSAAGKQAQCPSCGAVMTLSSASAAPSDPGLVVPPGPISQQPVIGPTVAVPGFGLWYTTKFGQLPVVVQVVMWLFYGYLWIPIFYFASRGIGQAVPAGAVQAQRRIRGPSLGLVITGILGAGLAACAALACLSREPDVSGAPIWMFSAAIQGFVAYAGFRMMNLRNYGVARVGSILAMLPCSPSCLLGLPIGIWSLVILSKPEVKSAFH